MADPQNDKVTAALTVDRSPSVGNSLGCDNRNALHTKVKNCPDEPIAVVVVDGPTPTPTFPAAVFFDNRVTSTPGTPQTIFSLVVPAGKMRRLHQCVVSYRMGSEWRLEVDAVAVAGGGTTAGQCDSIFSWSVSRQVNTGSTIELIVETASGMPAAIISAHIQAEDITL